MKRAILFVLALALAAAGCGPSYTTEEATLERYNLEVVERGSGRASILMVPIHGIITSEDGSAPATIAMLRQLRTEGTPSGIKVIILHVDSPGGDVTTSDVLADEISRCQKKGIKVVAFVSDLAASGAYYASAGADQIISRPTGIVGSIGVIMMHFDAEKLLTDRLGVKDESLVSGPFKGTPSVFRPMRPDERAYLQNIVDSLYGRFVRTVAQGRGMKDAEVRQVADGRVFTAEEAKRLGLIDAIGQRDDAIAAARRYAGENATVIYFKREPSFFEQLSGAQTQASPVPREAATMLRMAVQQRMLYLWRP